jgi:hypothetical protein
MSGLTPAGTLAQSVIPIADADFSVSPRPAPVAGNDGVDWIVLLEIDAYQVPAS